MFDKMNFVDHLLNGISLCTMHYEDSLMHYEDSLMHYEDSLMHYEDSLINPLPYVPILSSSNSAANKNMSKIWTNRVQLSD